MAEDLYDVAREVTDKTLGDGTYAQINEDHPDPGVQATIARWREGQASFAAEMQEQGIHVGMGSPGVCVTCGEAWPCNASS